MRTVVGIRPARKGNSTPQGNDPRPTVWFDSWRQLAGVLSDENRQLLRVIRENEPRTVMELAQLSGRAASNLSRTLRTLEHYGLVDFIDVQNLVQSGLKHWRQSLWWCWIDVA